MVLNSAPFRLLTEVAILLHGVVFLVLLLASVVLTTPLLIYRWGLSQVAKWVYPGTIGELVSPMSANMGVELLNCGKKNGHPPRSTIVVSLVLDGNVKIEEVEELLSSKWFGPQSRYPELRQFVDSWKGFLFWKDDLKFSLSNHLHSHSIEGETDAEVEERICLFQEELLNTPFPPKRSPWDVYIVNNYRNSELQKESVNGGELTLILFRIHHSIGDGYSILNAVIDGLLGISLSEISLPTPKEPGWSMKQKIVFPFKVFYDMAHLIARLYFPVTPIHVPPSRAPGKVFYFRNPSPISVKEIKDIKNKHGASFTAVILSGLSAAVGKTVEDLRRKQGGKVVEFMDFLVPIPLGRVRNNLRNHVTVANLELPISPGLHPLERLKMVEQQLATAKNCTVPLSLLVLLNWTGSLPTFMLKAIARNDLFPAGFSSFPGPGVEMQWNGKKLLAANLVAGLILPGVAGAAFFLMSFRNEIRIATCVEVNVMTRKEVKLMIGRVCEEFDKLFELSALKSEED